MDIATLAATAVAALTPYVKDAVEDFAGKAGELALEKAKALFQRLKDKFSGDGYIEGALSRFEKAPEEYASAVEKIIQEAAEKDAQFADYVGTLVDEIEAVSVAEVVPFRVIRIVACTNCIDIKLFHQFNVSGHRFQTHIMASIRVVLVAIHTFYNNGDTVDQELTIF